MKTVNLEHLKTLQNLDWTKIKYFYYVAKLGSFTKAARFLNNTQPGLSRQIGLLEKDLNCTLFYRGARGVILTRKGEELFNVMERCFLDMKSFNFNHITMSDDGAKRKIRVAATHPMTAYILRDHLVEFSLMHPDVILEIIAEDHSIDLTLNDIDIAIRPFDSTLQNVQQEHLCTLEKKLFASIQYIEKHGEPKSIEDLANHAIIAFAEPDKHPYADVNWILRLGRASGSKHMPAFTSNSLELLVEASKKGLGIIGSYEEMSLIKNANLKRILANIKGPINKDYIIYHDFVKHDKTIIDLKNFLISKFKD